MIGFAGMSHLGIVSALATASRGFAVLGYDGRGDLCAELGRGRFPVHEPDLRELWEQAGPNARFSADPAELGRCDLVYYALDIPTDDDHRSDLSALDRLVEETVPHLAAGTTLVVLSQVPPGYTRALARRLGKGKELHVYYQVETLIFGQAVERALRPERYIVGCPDPAAPLPGPFAALLNAFGCPVLPMRYESAELAKISVNLFLVSSVSLTNTLAEVCEAVGADWAEIAPALRLDRRIGPHAYLSPGLGIGGGNLARDLATVDRLAREWGTEAGILGAWAVNSSHRRDWALRTLHAEVLSRVADPVIAVWGLAYKADTASTKNSPAVALLRALRPFAVRAYDPQAVLDADLSNCVQASAPLEACRGADALAILTPWPEFREVPPAAVREAMRGRVVLDPFAVIAGPRWAAAGLSHFRLGCPPAREATA